MKDLHVLLKIFRFNPYVDSSPAYIEYEVPWSDGLLLLQAVKYVRDNLDETLSFRDYCCGCTWCSSCMMMVNGKGVRTCSRPLKPGESLTIEPLRGFRVIKDLAVDFDEKVSKRDSVSL